MMLKIPFVLLALVLGAGLSSGALAKGRLGFVTKVDVSGVFSPVLNHVKVESVTPGSPADTAGMKAGDYIVEADGRTVAGSPAKEMAARIRGIKPGEELRLKLKRGSNIVTATLVAGS